MKRKRQEREERGKGRKRMKRGRVSGREGRGREGMDVRECRAADEPSKRHATIMSDPGPTVPAGQI